LLFPWHTGFLAKLIADVLSIFSFTVILLMIFISLRSYCNQLAWDAAKDPATYSASQLERAMTDCFLEHQETGLLETWISIHSTPPIHLITTPICIRVPNQFKLDTILCFGFDFEQWTFVAPARGEKCSCSF
jgi:hypothetical protein